MMARQRPWRHQRIRRCVMQIQHVLISVYLVCLLTAGMAAAGGSGPGGCYDPAQYGAIPDDGLDDRPAAQKAIDAAAAAGGGRVCFGAGHWTLTRAPAGSYNPYAALSIHAPDI